jgi:DNA repair exonuclease SbcCD ATPase subunit
MSSLVSQENKELLWSLLAEEGLFDGIPDNVTPEEIKHVFERILKNLSATIPSLHAAKLKELHLAKRHAILEEDYDSAKKLRATIDEMEAPLARLEKLEARKLLAIQSEDYEAAKQIKTEIDRIRAASFSLKELNKIAIESLAVNIPKLARDISAIKSGGTVGGGGGRFGVSHPHDFGSGGSGGGGSVREIYNAEDFHSQKRQEVEMKMREKEAEMRSFFEVPRPAEIDFSDIPRDARPAMRLKARPDAQGGPSADKGNNDDDGDSPLAADGDDMEKLIAERIAARQRDLEEITERIKASMPPSAATAQTQQHQPTEYNPNDVMPNGPPPITLPPPPPPALQTIDTRKVRFQEDTTPIFLKLKRKPMADNERNDT